MAISKTKVITGVNTRLSYFHGWEPTSINNGSERYSVSVLIPKSDTETVKAIHNRIFDISDCGGNGSPDVGENRGHRGMDCRNDRGNRCLNGIEDICDSGLYRINYC